MSSPESRIPNPDSRPSPDSRLFILVAGESSGDLLGANLIADLRERFPEAHFSGIGGPLMAAAGMEIWHRAERLSVMGLAEVVRHLPALLRLRRDVFRRTLQARPAAFIGIDAPDFNLGLERKLKRAGIVTVHYVSPSIWAWREKRAEKIGRSADRVLCLFPMEPAIYARHGVDARFVGHPLASIFAMTPDRSAARAQLGLNDHSPVLALLPGSRLSEIARLGRDFVDAARLLQREFPDLQVVAPMANAACHAAFEHVVRDSGLGRASPESPIPNPESRIRILSPESRLPNPDSQLSNSRFPIPDSRLSPSHTAMIAADAVLLASGTAALEATLAKSAMVVAYRVAPVTYFLVKALRLLRTSVYSLPNILAGKTIVPELMQDACTPAALAAALAPLLRARALDAATLAEFARLHESLRGDQQHNAAAAILELLALRDAARTH